VRTRPALCLLLLDEHTAALDPTSPNRFIRLRADRVTGAPTTEGPPPSRARWWRIGALLAFIALTFVVAKLTGATEHLTRDGVVQAVHAAGAWGVVAFICVFAVRELVHVPGPVFVIAAVKLWGPFQGGALAGAGALVSLVTSFAVVRAVGGKPLGGVKSGLAGRLLANLERHRLRTVALCRLLLVLAPPVTYALALSGVSFHDYMLGSAVGLVVPLTLFVVGAHFLPI